MTVEREGDRWLISAAAPEIGSCPGCGARSRLRHSRYSRHLQDLPVQGAIVTLKLLMTRVGVAEMMHAIDKPFRTSFPASLSDMLVEPCVSAICFNCSRMAPGVSQVSG